MKTMKTKLIDLLTEQKEIYFTELPHLMPEIKGKYAMYMPVKEGVNPNILWLAGVTQEFIDIFNELFNKEKKIDIEVRGIFLFLADQKPIYTHVPIAKPKSLNGKKECWLPIIIKLV